MATLEQYKEQGFDVLRLSNQVIELDVIPGLGAKIISLVHKRTGRQWMWRPTDPPRYQRLPNDGAYHDGPLVGADECIPTISPCQWRGLNLPDHGEVWNVAWEVDEAELEQQRIVTRVGFAVSPLALQRTVRLDGSTVQLDYELTNLSGEPFEYIWAFHPILTLHAGDRIVLPSDCARVRSELLMGDCPLVPRQAGWSWPVPLAGVDLAHVELGGPGRAVKLFTDPLSVGRAAVLNEHTGEQLQFQFDAAINNTVGLWLNRGGWNDWEHMIVEPTNGAPDALDMAVRDWKRFGLLTPHETRKWQLAIELTAT